MIPDYDAPCQHPHPFHSSGCCDCWAQDDIHGDPSGCDPGSGEPCINPSAHHDFVHPSFPPPKAGWIMYRHVASESARAALSVLDEAVKR